MGTKNSKIWEQKKYKIRKLKLQNPGTKVIKMKMRRKKGKKQNVAWYSRARQIPIILFDWLRSTGRGSVTWNLRTLLCIPTFFKKNKQIIY
jgi:hypothetical protein